jgi:hypothetical protein
MHGVTALNSAPAPSNTINYYVHDVEVLMVRNVKQSAVGRMLQAVLHNTVTKVSE